jgi:hypothetical protein
MANWRALVHKVEVDGISVQYLSIKSQKVHGIVALRPCVTNRLNDAEVKQTIDTGLVDVEGD